MKYILLLLCLSTPAYSGVFKWVDADGNIHYGDRPNSGSTQKIKIKPAPSSSGGTSNNLKAIKSWVKARDMERSIKNKKEAEFKKEKSLEKKKCADLRIELADMEQGGFIWYDLDKNGKRIYYSDKKMTAEITAFKNNITKKCPL